MAEPSLLNALWLCVAGAACVQAADARLTLSASRTTATVGEPIVITCGLADAPAFRCWGAVMRVPGSGIALLGQSPGSAVVHVPDSRADPGLEIRFGGHASVPAAAPLAPGSHAIGSITIQASTTGTFIIRAPAWSPDEPFGGVLLPGAGAASVIPREASLTITIVTGGTVNRPPVISSGPLATPAGPILP
jgi:hypothetical protein